MGKTFNICYGTYLVDSKTTWQPRDINIQFQILAKTNEPLEIGKVKLSVFTPWRRFGAIALMMEAVSISETSVNYHETTRRNIPKDTRFSVVTAASMKMTVSCRCTTDFAETLAAQL
jgi:hypothetical protein